MQPHNQHNRANNIEKNEAAEAYARFIISHIKNGGIIGRISTKNLCDARDVIIVKSGVKIAAGKNEKPQKAYIVEKGGHLIFKDETKKLGSSEAFSTDCGRHKCGYRGVTLYADIIPQLIKKKAPFGFDTISKEALAEGFIAILKMEFLFQEIARREKMGISPEAPFAQEKLAEYIGLGRSKEIFRQWPMMNLGLNGLIKEIIDKPSSTVAGLKAFNNMLELADLEAFDTATYNKKCKELGAEILDAKKSGSLPSNIGKLIMEGVKFENQKESKAEIKARKTKEKRNRLHEEIKRRKLGKGKLPVLPPKPF